MNELKYYKDFTTNNPQNLVVFLHGYGSNGENLISLSNDFKSAILQANFISPNAVEDWEGGFPNCYQWFSLYNYNGNAKPFDEVAKNIKQSNKKLTDFIDDQLNQFNLTEENLILIGFSQGAMMAIYNSLTRKKKVKAVIAYSGRVILPQLAGDLISSRPEICLIHGRNDSVVPFSHFIDGQKILKENNISFKAHDIDNLDHSINLLGIKYAIQFLNK
jgi:phospholipase/carboxylesterase